MVVLRPLPPPPLASSVLFSEFLHFPECRPGEVVRSRCNQLRVFTRQERKKDSDGERFPKRLRLKTQPVLLLRRAPLFFLPLWWCKLASMAPPQWISPTMSVRCMFEMDLWLERDAFGVYS